MIATTGYLAAVECTKFDFSRGSAPDPTGELTVLPQTCRTDVMGDPSKSGLSESGPSELLVTLVTCVKTAERIITEPSPDLYLYLHLELSVLRAACSLLYAAAVFC